MKCVLFFLHVTLFLHSVAYTVLTSPPAPVKVYVDSRNFYHVLRWDPGPGTPPGTLYYITQRDDDKEERLTSNTTWLELQLDDFYEYRLTVQAFYNETLSKKSKAIIFSPEEHTHIDPAEVSLSGCGNCIQINISMPERYRRSGMDNYHNYDPTFIIYWRKANELTSKIVEIYNKSYTLHHLEKGIEYCVQVDTKIRTNPNTKASDWKCTSTSPEAESHTHTHTGSSELGAVSALMIVLAGALMISLSCLYYAGFVGKLRATVPRALIVALRQGYTLTPETTRTYLISVTSETGKQRIHNNPTASRAATSDAKSEKRSEDEEEEEENEIYDYLDRDAELSTDESAFSRTNVSDHCKPAASGNSSSSQVEKPPAEFDIGLVQAGLDQDDCKVEGATVSFTSEEGQSKVQGQLTAEQEDCTLNAYDSSGNVNLFSVTISALLVDVEEEQDTRDTLTARYSNISLNNADTQMTESDNQVTVASVCPTQKDFTKAGYEGRHAQAGEEEEEEEEESSEYMRHV